MLPCVVCKATRNPDRNGRRPMCVPPRPQNVASARTCQTAARLDKEGRTPPQKTATKKMVSHDNDHDNSPGRLSVAWKGFLRNSASLGGNEPDAGRCGVVGGEKPDTFVRGKDGAGARILPAAVKIPVGTRRVGYRQWCGSRPSAVMGELTAARICLELGMPSTSPAQKTPPADGSKERGAVEVD